jgi:hypothetical protein
VTRLRYGQSGVRLPAEEMDFCLRNVVHPASYSFGCRVSFPGVKRPGREVNHSSPFDNEVNKQWNCASAHSVYLRGADRGKFAFSLFLFIINYSFFRCAFLAVLHC